MISLLRWLVGRLILLLNALFPPKILLNRSPEAQAQVDGETARMTLYQFEACPFCVRVRRTLGALGLSITTKDARRNPAHKGELLAGGGRSKVPCLKIEGSDGAVQWMYESKDIIAYLRQRFSE